MRGRADRYGGYLGGREVKGQVQRVEGWGQVLGASLKEEVGVREERGVQILSGGMIVLGECAVPMCAVAQIGTGEVGWSDQGWVMWEVGNLTDAEMAGFWGLESED